MTNKTKHSKVPKSGKTRLSDLTPKKDARGGVEPTPPDVTHPKLTHRRKPVTL